MGLELTDAPQASAVALTDRYLLESGRIYCTGVQALVRVIFDQLRADRAAGLRPAAFVSGYQGSPLGGLDTELAAALPLVDDLHVVHRPGVNEELAATAVWGSQLAHTLPAGDFDRVVGIWYGKGPGLDRAADALRHANYSGVAAVGGAVAFVGDDPSCKSSSLPSASEATLAALCIPTLYPANVQDVLDLGRHAFALSRAAGTWSALKIVTSVADGSATADVGLERVRPVALARPVDHRPTSKLTGATPLALERSLFDERLAAAVAYARANGLDRVTHDAPHARVGIVSAGKPYADLMQALQELGLDEAALAGAGVRILKLAMIWPLDDAAVRSFADGLASVLVVEEKRPFVEPAVRDALYGVADAPQVVGKQDGDGAPLIPGDGELDGRTVARALAGWLEAHTELEGLTERAAGGAAGPAMAPLPLARTPFFCSGCPHNTSTQAPDDVLVGAGIGCHAMVLANPVGRGTLTGVTQMGGEGAQWIGMEPFTSAEHLVQNLGDGTFHHSGSLAIRAAVAAGSRITFKLLYNGAVAMTGGQPVPGRIDVPALTRWLEAEGVARTIVTADDPGRYAGVTLAANAELRPREDLAAAQRELAPVDGVTVLVHDQRCAIEQRRARRRGTVPDPAQLVVINERVCEGCGDCGTASNCMSVLPVETEFGRKTRIHQASCNKDYSCLQGDCPSFLTIVPGKASAKRGSVPAPPALPDPPRIVADDPFVLRMVGIGGTGVVTVNQVLGMAARLDDRHVWSLDQTGLSQKGGPVISDLRISREPIDGANKATGIDLLVGLDLLGARDPATLDLADPARTVAVVSTSVTPTGQMVVDPDVHFPEVRDALDVIGTVTRAGDNAYLDAQALAERLFGTHLPANLIALGTAFQVGALPLSSGAIEQAIRLNGTGVDANLAAFAWGRAVVAAPDAVAALMRDGDEAAAPPPLTAAARSMIASVPAHGDVHRLLQRRVDDLIAYQSRAYAERYVATVRAAVDAERAQAPGRTELAEAVARQLHRLMAYKDEYEVARLHLDPVERARIRAEHGADAKVWVHLHPPVLRALGLRRKLRFGRWFDPGFRVLRAGRRLRGTPVDPFGRARVRQVERELIVEYEQLVAQALARLSAERHALAVELCSLPELVRGYEDIKLANVVRYRKRILEIQAELMSTSTPA